jgi:hypothetical protein
MGENAVAVCHGPLHQGPMVRTWIAYLGPVHGLMAGRQQQGDPSRREADALKQP